jgi:hypothetical protein
MSLIGALSFFLTGDSNRRIEKEFCHPSTPLRSAQDDRLIFDSPIGIASQEKA